MLRLAFPEKDFMNNDNTMAGPPQKDYSTLSLLAQVVKNNEGSFSLAVMDKSLKMHFCPVCYML